MFEAMEIDGIDAIKLGTGFLLAAPGVAVHLRHSGPDSWVAAGYETGSADRWIGSGGGTFEEALSFAHILLGRVQTEESKPRRRRRHRADLRVR
jgi:hypothetical protein